MMILNFTTISTLVNKIKFAYILINTKYFIYRVINSWFIRKTNLKHINISTKKLIGIGGKEGKISKIVKIEIDINKHL